MSHRRGTLVLIALAAVPAAPLVVPEALSLAAQQAQRITLTGDSVAVYNLAGEVTVEAGSGTSVVAEVRPAGADAGELRVERDASSLRIVYPDDRIVYPPLGRNSRTTMHVREDGTFGDDHGRGRRNSGREVTIVGSGSGTAAYADVRIQVPAGRALTVHLGVGSVTARNVNGRLRLDTASADVTATGTRGTLSVDVGSGNVTVTDADGDLSVDTGSGDVRLTSVRGSTLVVDTGSGNVVASGVRYPAANFDTGSGNISVSETQAARLNLDAGSGNIDVALTSDVEDLVVDTGSGNVTIRAPESLGAQVRIETGSGDIETAFPVQVTRRHSDELSGSIGDGRGRIAIETGSGDVRLVRP